jgi:AcrR family transcriptional regulator
MKVQKSLADSHEVTPAKPKQRRNREESSRRILQAGLDIFSELGYDAATTKAIATRAGVAEALIHRYFVNKVGLLQAIFVSEIASETESSSYPAGKTVEAEINNFFHHRCTHSEEKSRFVRLVLSRAILDREIAKLFNTEEIRPKEMLVLQERLKAFQKRGMIKASVNVRELTESISQQSLGALCVGQIIFGQPLAQMMKGLTLFTKNLVNGITDRTSTDSALR